MGQLDRQTSGQDTQIDRQISGQDRQIDRQTSGQDRQIDRQTDLCREWVQLCPQNLRDWLKPTHSPCKRAKSRGERKEKEWRREGRVWEEEERCLRTTSMTNWLTNTVTYHRMFNTTKFPRDVGNPQTGTINKKMSCNSRFVWNDKITPTETQWLTCEIWHLPLWVF